MAQKFNNPPATQSTIGEQAYDGYLKEKALRAVRRTQYFLPLADVTAQPRHYGKKIKQFLMLPLLDDDNVNDQGINAQGVTITNGNLYGSSDDVGTVLQALPTLTETGGSVNRVGFSRILLTAELSLYGFYSEYTKEAVNFDNDAELEMHYVQETLQGASDITEDVLQIDLLNGAGLVRYAGIATSRATVTGEGADISEVTYSDLIRLQTDLTNNKTPYETTMITGSLKTDTVTVGGGRPMYVSPDLLETLMAMPDHHGKPAFEPVHKYADAGNILKGEEGRIAKFRVILVPEMKVYRGEGANVGTNGGYRETGGKYDVYPMLVVGKGSFTSVGFETDGRTHKFVTKHVKPGSDGSYAIDRHGQIGFVSINWYISTLILRSERIAVIYTVCKS